MKMCTVNTRASTTTLVCGGLCRCCCCWSLQLPYKFHSKGEEVFNIILRFSWLSKPPSKCTWLPSLHLDPESLGTRDLRFHVPKSCVSPSRGVNDVAESPISPHSFSRFIYWWSNGPPPPKPSVASHLVFQETQGGLISLSIIHDWLWDRDLKRAFYSHSNMFWPGELTHLLVRSAAREAL